jgi:microcystin-dependent protein
MIINSSATVKLGSTLVTRVSGDTWQPITRPAFFKTSAFSQLFMVAEVDNTDGNWIQLCRPYNAPSQTNIPVEICMDYTPTLNLPVGNPGDVDMADLFNRALLILDRQPLSVPLHGPSHVGLGLDPVPLASTTDSGLLGRLSGNSTDYVGGDNICHQMAGVPSGAMLPFGGAAIPIGWLLCDGRAVSRSSYNNLFAVTGTTYGTGDGLTTFNLPDYRGRVFIGAGAGPGLTNRVLGTKYGEENHVLTVAELAAHGHGVGQNPHHHSAASYNSINYGTGTPWYQFYEAVAANSGDGYADISISNTGGGAGHNTIPPCIAANVIIKT